MSWAQISKNHSLRGYMFSQLWLLKVLKKLNLQYFHHHDRLTGMALTISSKWCITGVTVPKWDRYVRAMPGSCVNSNGSLDGDWIHALVISWTTRMRYDNSFCHFWFRKNDHPTETQRQAQEHQMSRIWTILLVQRTQVTTLSVFEPHKNVDNSKHVKKEVITELTSVHALNGAIHQLKACYLDFMSKLTWLSIMSVNNHSKESLFVFDQTY